MSEAALRDALVARGALLASRGLAHGSSGNLSVRSGEGFLMTPTGSALGRLDPARLSKLDGHGHHVAGDAPTKEAFLHLAVYAKRPSAQAIVHLHCTCAVAVSCLVHENPANVLPPLTAYQMMRVGPLPLVPYHPPGDRALAAAVEALAERHKAVLLANHGPVVAGSSLDGAAESAEELEESAKLALMLHGRTVRALTGGEIEELARRFPS